MTGLSVRQWQDRLLVLRGQTPVAWLDGQTGAVLQQAQPVAAAEVQLAYDQWREGWEDLADNAPGMHVRERAIQEKQAMSGFASFAARVFDVKTDERAWRLGAQGEHEVGVKLAKLRRRGFEVLHSLSIGTRGSDIDHLLIGPTGVFTINTKNRPGANIWVRHDTVKVNGHWHNVAYVRKARFEAGRVQRLLGQRLGWAPPVSGVVVVLAKQLTVKQPPEDVHVVGGSRVPRWFRQWPTVLQPEHVQAVYAVARQSTTWG